MIRSLRDPVSPGSDLRPPGARDGLRPDARPDGAIPVPRGGGAGPPTVVVVPTYDERDNLPALAAALREHAPHTHLAIVDDGSPDGTGAIADRLAAARPGEVHVIHRTGKQGLGTAYVAGFRRALELGYSRVVQMDCDFSHDPAVVPALLAALDEEPGADLVIGSRYVPGGGTVNWGLIRKLVSRAGSGYARAVLAVRYRDLTAGFKAWRREALEAIPLEQVAAQGYCFQIEMTYRAHLLGMRIREVPIVFVDRRVGRSKMSRRIVLEAVARCWTLRRELRPRRAGRSRDQGRPPWLRRPDRPPSTGGPPSRAR